MWPVLAILTLLLGVALHLGWRRRCRDLADQLAHQRRETAALQERYQGMLNSQNAQREVLFNNMIEGVLVLDARGRVQLVNQALRNLFQLQGDIRDKTIIEAFRLHELQALVNRVAVDGKVLDFELNLHGIEERCLQVNATALYDDNGQRYGMILVFHNLTRIKQLENARKEFVANVSHELRTPLSIIKGYVETLLDGAHDDREVTHRFLRTIARHADRLNFLIEDLLTISRLESGSVVLNRQPVALRQAVGRAFDDLKERAAEKDVTFLNETPADLAAYVDDDRLQQVLFNLVDNAIKYGRNQSQVSVGAVLAKENLIRVCVRDNGPGIPPEAIERIFERFYRVDRGRSREQGGTGLGLSIVKHIVHSHGGEVWVESRLGEGTTFWFTLPVATGNQVADG